MRRILWSLVKKKKELCKLILNSGFCIFDLLECNSFILATGSATTVLQSIFEVFIEKKKKKKNPWFINQPRRWEKVKNIHDKVLKRGIIVKTVHFYDIIYDVFRYCLTKNEKCDRNWFEQEKNVYNGKKTVLATFTIF